MKKSNKIIFGFLIMSIVATLVTGCSGNSSATTASSTPNKQTRGNFDPAAMKTRYEDALNALVVDATITQDQSDKVLVVMMKNIQLQGSPRPQGSSKPQTSPNNQGGNGQKQRANPLAELVTSAVITQAQSDTIMSKLRGNFGKPNNGQPQPTDQPNQ